MKNKKRKKLKKGARRWIVVAVCICALFIVDIALYRGIKHYYPDVWEKEAEPIVKTSSANQKAISDALKDVNINSRYAILIDMEDQKTLFERNADKRIYPASLTKVLTAITALDETNDMRKKATVNSKDLAGLLEQNASVAGLAIGDKLSYEQALYALVLPSGADAANFLANHLAGSVDQFVKDMNIKAKALGMTHTHFVNTSGLHDDQHYTTLNDMKKMMMHAWKNPVFREVMSTVQYTLNGLTSHPNGLKLKSTLLLYGGNLAFNGGEIIGGKSGYTDEAECCLISLARMKDGHLYMLITAKASGVPLYDQSHMKDAKKIYEIVAQHQ